jgi:hypothetical protein
MTIESILKNLMQTLKWSQKRLSAVQREVTLLIQCRLNLFPVPRHVDVLGLPHGVLITIRAAYIARHACRTEFDAHRAVGRTVAEPPLIRMNPAETVAPLGEKTASVAGTEFLAFAIALSLLKSAEVAVEAVMNRWHPLEGNALGVLSAMVYVTPRLKTSIVYSTNDGLIVAATSEWSLCPAST